MTVTKIANTILMANIVDMLH